MPTYFRPARVDVLEGGGELGAGLMLAVLGGALVLGSLAAALAWLLTNLLLIAAVLGGLGVVSGGAAALIVRWLYKRHTLVYVGRPAPAPVTVRAEVIRQSGAGAPILPAVADRKALTQGEPMTGPHLGRQVRHATRDMGRLS